MAQSLYERLGGTEGIRRIASNLVDRHIANPKIGARFAGSDVATVKRHAADFFITGSGGPEVYTGKSMLEAHHRMNISDEEYMAAVDDVMAALSDEGIGDTEKGEVLFIFYSLRPEVVRV
ncbi:MAG: group 1 truncated hemoglobin [Alphaproteobacteria bacterium]|nr:MAG: group 1 truncated hemoglobin [Alphaproteobacteria bacterium]